VIWGGGVSPGAWDGGSGDEGDGGGTVAAAKPGIAMLLLRGGGFEPPADMECTVRFGGYGAEHHVATLLAGGTKLVANVPRRLCEGDNIAITVFAGHVPSTEFILAQGLGAED
jgi:hypothetical protein